MSDFTDDQVWRAYGEFRLMKAHGLDDVQAMKRAMIVGCAARDPDAPPGTYEESVLRGKMYYAQDALR